MATYHIPASDMGEGYTEQDMVSLQDYIRAEMDADGNEDDDVFIIDNPRSFIPLWRDDIRSCVERAWHKWIIAHS